MANRTSAKSNIITKNVPTVTNAILTDMLNSDLADNLVFREDVAVLQNSSVSNITVDFTNKDRIDLTRTGGSLNITVTGLGDGDVKYLLIAKTAGQAVTFVGVTDVTPIKANANALSLVLYEITRKSSYYFAKAWVENVKSATDTIEGVLETATQSESNALSAVNKIITPGRQPIASTTQKGLVELATLAEANALTSALLAITPATLPSATSTQKGIIEVASAAENDAGTAGNLAVIASELKRKYDALSAIFGGTATVTLSGVTASPFSFTNPMTGLRNNRVSLFFGKITSSGASGGLVFVKHVDGYVSPGDEIGFGLFNDNETLNVRGWGYLDTGGDIYMTVTSAGTWRFSFVAIY